jgi:hypothetical protein
MRSKIATLALAGALGLTGVAGAALGAPALSYAATGDSTALEDRVASLKQALAGLVTDGTLTQAQADEVAATLAERGPSGGPGRHGGPGGRGGLGGPGLASALEDLGITSEEVRAAAEAGTTLAELAKQQGVSSDELVDALVAAGDERLDEAVAAGRLTQAEADEKAADLEARITERLDEPVRLGRGGRHHSHDDGDEEDSAPSQAPSAAPSQSDDA